MDDAEALELLTLAGRGVGTVLCGLFRLVQLLGVPSKSSTLDSWEACAPSTIMKFVSFAAGEIEGATATAGAASAMCCPFGINGGNVVTDAAVGPVVESSE